MLTTAIEPRWDVENGGPRPSLYGCRSMIKPRLGRSAGPVGPLVGTARPRRRALVTELHEQGLVVKLLDDRADLSARKPLRGKVRQQCHHVQKGGPSFLAPFF